MADDLHIRVGGIWKSIDDCQIKVAGAWKQPDSVHVRVGGVWKQVWAGVSYNLTNASNSAFKFGSNATAYLYVNADGTVDSKDNASPNQQINSSTDWCIPNAATTGLERVRHEGLTGDTGSYVGSMSATYSTLGTRYFAVVDSTPGFGGKSVTATVRIDDGSGNSLASALWTVTADREDF